MATVDLWLGLVGTALGVASLVYAVKTQREQERWEKLVQAKLAGIAGSALRIRKNSARAHKNIDYLLMNCLDDMKALPQYKEIVNHLAWAQGDSASAHRMLEELAYDVLDVQQGMFGTRLLSGQGLGEGGKDVGEDVKPG